MGPYQALSRQSGVHRDPMKSEIQNLKPQQAQTQKSGPISHRVPLARGHAERELQPRRMPSSLEFDFGLSWFAARNSSDRRTPRNHFSPRPQLRDFRRAPDASRLIRSRRSRARLRISFGFRMSIPDLNAFLTLVLVSLTLAIDRAPAAEATWPEFTDVTKPHKVQARPRRLPSWQHRRATGRAARSSTTITTLHGHLLREWPARRHHDNRGGRSKEALNALYRNSATAHSPT